MATGHSRKHDRTTNCFIPPSRAGICRVSRADHVPHDCATVLYGWLTSHTTNCACSPFPMQSLVRYVRPLTSATRARSEMGSLSRWEGMCDQCACSFRHCARAEWRLSSPLSAGGGEEVKCNL